MFRFSIRDLIWLTVVVAIGVGWWIQRDKAQRARLDYDGALIILDRMISDIDREHPEWRQDKWYLAPVEQEIRNRFKAGK